MDIFQMKTVQQAPPLNNFHLPAAKKTFGD